MKNIIFVLMSVFLVSYVFADYNNLSGIADSWLLETTDTGFDHNVDYIQDGIINFKDYAFLAMPDAWNASKLYFVSASTGNDANPGTIAQPFKTISKAATLATAGTTCFVRSGVYREQINIGLNGNAAQPVIFSGYLDEYPVISGTDVLNLSWSIHSDNIYKATTTKKFIQLFVDGRMYNEARWPNAVVDDLVHMPRAVCDNGTNATTLVDNDLPAGDWNGATVHIVPGAEWISWTKTINSYQPGVQFNFSDSTWENNSSDYLPKEGNYYWLFGSLAGLDIPTEWFLDKVKDKIYIYCDGDINPANHLIEVKSTRNYAFTLYNRQYVTIKSFKIFCGAIETWNAQHCTIDDCHVKYVEHFTTCNGYYTNSYTNRLGGQYNEWKNSSIVYSAGNGIYSDGSYNKVTNCIIHDVDYMAGHLGAIREWSSIGSEFTYNTMYNSGRHIIYHAVNKQFKYNHNHMYNAGLLSADCGITYCWDVNSLGGEIAYNKVHGNYARWGCGIYLDAFDGYPAIGFSIHHNLIWDFYWSGIHLNDPSLNNGVYNNTILSTCNQATGCYAAYPPADQTGTKFINNLHKCPIGWFADPPYAPEVHHNGNYAIDANSWPTPGSGAIDAGVAITGITDGYQGLAPDIGCYETGSSGWTAGADWTEFAWSF